MKKIFPIFLVVVIVACEDNQDAGETTETSETVLQETVNPVDNAKELILNSYQQIWTDLDESGIEKFYTTDFMLYTEGNAWSNDSVVAYVSTEKERKMSDPYVMTYDIEFLTTDEVDSEIHVSYLSNGYWSNESGAEVNLQWSESATVIQEDGIWKIKEIQSNLIDTNEDPLAEAWEESGNTGFKDGIEVNE